MKHYFEPARLTFNDYRKALQAIKLGAPFFVLSTAVALHACPARYWLRPALALRFVQVAREVAYTTLTAGGSL